MQLLNELQQLADWRAEREDAIADALQIAVEAAADEFEATAQSNHEQFSARSRELETQFAAAKETAATEYEQAVDGAESQLAEALEQLERDESDAMSAAKQAADSAKWEAEAVFDASKDKPHEHWERASKKLSMQAQQLEALQRDAESLLGMRRLSAQAADDVPPPEADSVENAEVRSTDIPERPAADRVTAAVTSIREAVIAMQEQRMATLFLENGGPLGWLVGAVVLGSIGGALVAAVAGISFMAVAIGAAVAVAVTAALLWGWLLPRGRRQSLQKFAEIRRDVQAALADQRQALTDAKAAAEAEAAAIVRRRDDDCRAADLQRDQQVHQARGVRADGTARLTQEHEAQLKQLADKRDADVAAAESEFPPKIEQNAAERTAAERENDQRYEQARAAAQQRQAADFAALAEKWQRGFAKIIDELAAIRQRARQLFPDWETTKWSDWRRPPQRPEAIAVGGYELPLSIVKHGAPKDPQLAPPVDRLPLTAAMSLVDRPRLVLTAEGDGRRAAVDVLQLAMLRMLTTFPAGLVRFTLIDPAGLGESFGPFMHLADYDEQLAPKQVFTEPKRIEERLALITAHMEKVLQKYLRNEFATLEEYNAQAGEVAEPYHMIVVANFPNGMSEAAARRLTTIAEAGPRCGVYVLMSVDRGAKLPHEFTLDPLVTGAMHLDWTGEHFTWRYPLFEKLPLALDSLPSQGKLTEILRRAALESREASRVEVAFEKVAPANDAVGTSDSARELVVPIGRAGAKELQSLRLGRGTSQHVLISGKTGSGKSTLLHALITNAALHYSPRQLEFYLVDFKKGVEFKAYAAAELPHARVIAIESEREFGVSVLERLDAELRRRGELFREHGVQDLAGFRAIVPDVPMPRTLLIVDEFQELFVADDKLAQDAALLLDRLVRQGRAFGVHVILGSQTLAGAYSLARSTLGQMAVRIALECSDADAHLILSDENQAARLLSRPGEAIYNDQNGLVAGNQPFQVAWLPDEQRRDYLHALNQRPESTADAFDPTIVFEGNLPADPSDNRPLIAALAGPDDVAEPVLWLGSAVRIEPPTSLTLRRQSGQNLVILGNEEQSALGMLSAALAAIIGQQRDRGVRITVLDGARPESQEHGAWQRIAAALGDAVKRLAPPDAAGVVAALAEEVARRSAETDAMHAPRYLIVHDLSQFRDLRLTEDEFSFGSSKKPPSPDRLFRDVLKEGPSVGVHVLLWCDSYNALTRVIDRITLRELDYRVALPMSAGDSTSFIESPAAGRLGEYRAILYRDDLGTQTKFRPYGRPTPERLAWLAEQLHRERAAQ